MAYPEGTSVADPDLAEIARTVALTMFGDIRSEKAIQAGAQLVLPAVRAAATLVERQVREQVGAVIISADSLLSLIRYREGSALSEQTRIDIDALMPRLRAASDAAARIAGGNP